MKLQKINLVVFQILLLASCTSYVTSKVSVFENWNNDGINKSYTFQEISPDNLEMRTYQKLVADELNKHGFSHNNKNTAEFLIKIDYGSREKLGNSVQTIWPLAFNMWPHRCAYTHNCIGQWNAWNRWDNAPQWVDSTYTFEEVFLTLLIIRQSDQKEVYRVLARADGNDLPLVLAMPYLVHSALEGFPQRNGSVMRVKLPRKLN